MNSQGAPINLHDRLDKLKAAAAALAASRKVNFKQQRMRRKVSIYEVLSACCNSLAKIHKEPLSTDSSTLEDAFAAVKSMNTPGVEALPASLYLIWLNPRQSYHIISQSLSGPSEAQIADFINALAVIPEECFNRAEFQPRRPTIRLRYTKIYPATSHSEGHQARFRPDSYATVGFKERVSAQAGRGADRKTENEAITGLIEVLEKILGEYGQDAFVGAAPHIHDINGMRQPVGGIQNMERVMDGLNKSRTRAELKISSLFLRIKLSFDSFSAHFSKLSGSNFKGSALEGELRQALNAIPQERFKDEARNMVR